MLNEVKITKAENQPKTPLSEYIFGNFMESGFASQISMMWSEMFYNRSFCKVTPKKAPTWEWLGFTEDMYNENAPFWHSGYEEHDWEFFGDNIKYDYTLGTQTFKGKRSLHIENKGSKCGLRQAGLHFKKDKSYTLKVFGGVRGDMLIAGLDGYAMSGAEGADRTVTLSLTDSQGNVFWQRHVTMTVGQREYSFSVCAESDCVACFELSFEYEGGLYLSWVSLMPNDNMKGWRKEVVNAIKEAGVPVMRFPGGCFVSFYDWEKSIGSRERREPMESFYWGGLEENDVGIDEFCDLAEMAGFEPHICFNMMSSTPFKARQLVEYLNAPCDVGMGRLRMLNGHKNPRGVKLFEMDNETSRKWEALEYARECVKFAREMRLADPDIEFMMEGYNFPTHKLRAMLDIAGGDINYLIQRNGDPEFVAEMLEIIRKYNKDTGRNIKLVNTEWLPKCDTYKPFEDSEIPQHFSWSGEMTNDYRKSFSFFQISWFYALNGAHRLLDYMSYGGEFALASFNNCCNTWGQNIINASKDSVWLSCAGEMTAFMKRWFKDGAMPVNMDTDDELVRAQRIDFENGQSTLYLINHSTDEKRIYIGNEFKNGEMISADDRLVSVRENTSPIATQNVACEDGYITLKPLSICALSK